MYLIWMRQNIIERSLSLNCSKKMSVEEYEFMKKYNTQYHLEKLRNSEEFKKFIQNKMNNKEKNDFREMSTDEIKLFSDEE